MTRATTLLRFANSTTNSGSNASDKHSAPATSAGCKASRNREWESRFSPSSDSESFTRLESADKISVSLISALRTTGKRKSPANADDKFMTNSNETLTKNTLKRNAILVENDGAKSGDSFKNGLWIQDNTQHKNTINTHDTNDQRRTTAQHARRAYKMKLEKCFVFSFHFRSKCVDGERETLLPFQSLSQSHRQERKIQRYFSALRSCHLIHCRQSSKHRARKSSWLSS